VKSDYPFMEEYLIDQYFILWMRPAGQRGNSLAVKLLVRRVEKNR